MGKVAYRDNRTDAKIWKLLPGICTSGAVMDDTMLMFNRIRRLVIRVKTCNTFAGRMMHCQGLLYCAVSYRTDIRLTMSTHAGC